MVRFPSHAKAGGMNINQLTFKGNLNANELLSATVTKEVAIHAMI